MGPRLVFRVVNVMLGLSRYVFIRAGVALCRALDQPNMTSNPAIALRLQSSALVGRVAELGS